MTKRKMSALERLRQLTAEAVNHSTDLPGPSPELAAEFANWGPREPVTIIHESAPCVGFAFLVGSAVHQRYKARHQK